MRTIASIRKSVEIDLLEIFEFLPDREFDDAFALHCLLMSIKPADYECSFRIRSKVARLSTRGRRIE